MSVPTDGAVKLALLVEASKVHGVEKLANVILSDERFSRWSGSSASRQHHYGDGGLLQHTWEVWSLASQTFEFYRIGMKAGIMEVTHLPTMRELFLACLYHDVGKMWDYVKIDGVWQSAPHKRLIHHISRSAVEWTKAVEKTGEGRDIEDSVLHAILAHHGQRAWGSPVAPSSRLAWLVHISDMMSARMNDADKLDLIDNR